MTYFKCIGCNKQFSNSRSYSAHSRFCKSKVFLKARQRLAKRKAYNERLAANDDGRVDDMGEDLMVRVTFLS
ncbi:MAG TPA: hypothetical protein VGO47_08030 [Chlamydiales bacterium]|jgi:DNA-directed RNA polymerase subunit RPC12/RpoP|nr:hypothetical protein [Chlamydiales bacterium]